jgi:hypothetical protein
MRAIREGQENSVEAWALKCQGYLHVARGCPEQGASDDAMFAVSLAGEAWQQVVRIGGGKLGGKTKAREGRERDRDIADEYPDLGEEIYKFAEHRFKVEHPTDSQIRKARRMLTRAHTRLARPRRR